MPFLQLAVPRLPARRCLGKVDDTGAAAVDGGDWHGAHNKLPNGCGSTIRLARRCASATRRSTRRSTFRAEAR